MDRFYESFGDLADPRAQNVQHDLMELLFIALLATRNRKSFFSKAALAVALVLVAVFVRIDSGLAPKWRRTDPPGKTSSGACRWMEQSRSSRCPWDTYCFSEA